MGALRACYTTTARLTVGGPLVRLVWYWAEPDAPAYRGWHVFAPVQFVEDKYDVDDIVGEVPYARRPFYNGDNPGVTATGIACGTAADYLGQGTAPTWPNGRPDFSRWCGCGYKACVGVGAGHTLLVRERGELAAEASYAELPQTGGWYFSVLNGTTAAELAADHIRFDGQDSENCGGSNPTRQTGHARKHYQFTEPTLIHAVLNGHVERENADFDTISVQVDGVQVYFGGGFEFGEGCTMGDISDTLDVDVSAGTHTIDVFFDTVDGHFHVGLFWDVDLSFSPASPAEVAMEVVVTEYDTRDAHWKAEVAVEAGQGEGDAPEGGWVAELATEGVVTEGDAPEGGWVAEAAFEAAVTEYA